MAQPVGSGSDSTHDEMHAEAPCSPEVLARLVLDVSCNCPCWNNRLFKLKLSFTTHETSFVASRRSLQTLLGWSNMKIKKSPMQGNSRSPACAWNPTALCNGARHRCIEDSWGFWTGQWIVKLLAVVLAVVKRLNGDLMTYMFGQGRMDRQNVFIVTTLCAAVQRKIKNVKRRHFTKWS